MYPAKLEIKDTTETTTSASYLDLLLSIWRDGQLHTSIYDKRDDLNFHIPNFPFLSSNIQSSPVYGVLYDTPGLAPRMNVLFWGLGDFPVSFSNRDTSRNAWNRHSGSFMVDTGILFSNMKSPSHECYMTFWSLTNSDFPTNQTFHKFHDLDTEFELYRLWVVSMEHLQRVWRASGERLPFRTPDSVPHCGTCLCCNCWDRIPWTCHVFTRLLTSNTPWYFLDFAFVRVSI